MRWTTERTWPGGAWGEALKAVRLQQCFSQHDVAEFLGVGVGTVRSWERGESLPDQRLWSQLEGALAVRVPDPRMPAISVADREMIGALTAVVDELQHLRRQLDALTALLSAPAPPSVPQADLMDIKDAAAYLGVSVGTIRGWTYQRTLPYHRLGSLVRFARADLDAFVIAGRIAPTGPAAGVVARAVETRRGTTRSGRPGTRSTPSGG